MRPPSFVPKKGNAADSSAIPDASDDDVPCASCCVVGRSSLSAKIERLESFAM